MYKIVKVKKKNTLINKVQILKQTKKLIKLHNICSALYKNSIK